MSVFIKTQKILSLALCAVPEANWIQTKSGVIFFVYLRLYGPLESYFDKAWQPGDPKLAK